MGRVRRRRAGRRCAAPRRAHSGRVGAIWRRLAQSDVTPFCAQLVADVEGAALRVQTASLALVEAMATAPDNSVSALRNVGVDGGAEARARARKVLTHADAAPTRDAVRALCLALAKFVARARTRCKQDERRVKRRPFETRLGAKLLSVALDGAWLVLIGAPFRSFFLFLSCRGFL